MPLKHSVKIILQSLLLIVIFAANALEPNIRFKHLNLEQGLSQEYVTSIIQDSQGYMWFGTQEGLNRYDGYAFKVYLFDKLSSDSISSDSIFSLAEDNKEQLWVGTDGGGLNRLDRSSQKFIRYAKIKGDVTSLSHNTVRVIFNDSQNNLWVGTDGGLNLFNPKTNNFKRFSHLPSNDNSLSNNKVRSIVEDANGYLWIATDGGGVDRFDRKNKIFTHYRHYPNNSNTVASNRIKTALMDTFGNLWLGTYDSGVSLLPVGEQSFQHFIHDKDNPNSLADNYILDILQDHQSNIWFATDNGLSQWQRQSGGFINLRNDPLNKYSLGNNKVLSLFTDTGGVFWVGTNSGLNKWNSATGAFKHLRHRPGHRVSLSNNGVNAIEQTRDGQIWIGTYGGLNRFDGEAVHQFQSNSNGINEFSDQSIMSLFADPQQHLWIGTKKGLDRLDLETKAVKNYRHEASDSTSLSHNGVTAIIAAKGEQLWVATFGGGLNLFDPESQVFKHFRHDGRQKDSLSSDNVVAILKGNDNLLWVGTYGGGLNLFDPNTRKSMTYKNNPNDPNSISSDKIFALYQDQAKNLWIGTAGGGLNKLSYEDRLSGNFKFTQYNRRQGLPSSTIYGIEQDESGKLWLSSNRGLTKFDPVTEKSLNFDTSHGLQGNDFSFGAYAKDVQGNLYFGGTNGLTIFNPDEIKSNNHVPPVVLTKFLKMNVIDSENLTSNNQETIRIHYEDYFVAFEFAGLDYAQPSSNQYRYKLEGFDVSWVEADKQRRATYTNLPAGNYTFRVKAANNDGVWNEHGIGLSVTVLPPPWKSWWAYVIYWILAVTLLAISIKLYLNRLKKESSYRAKLKAEVHNRTTELQVANQQLLNASVTDQLTGLHNRRYLDEIIDKEVAEISRGFYADSNTDKNRPRLFFLMFDLDDFKPINDTHGHSAGDNVIRDVSLLLQQTCRHGDTVIRWGGDEFLIMGKVDDPTEVNLMAERLRQNIHDKIFEIGVEQNVQISCSIGFSFFPFSEKFPKLLSWEKVQIIADKALYRSKALGRNAWVGILENQKRLPASFMSMLTQNLDQAIDQQLVKLVEFSGYNDTKSDKQGITNE